MKITDKIVTLVELPSMTNVVWHNPDTNELKIYSKNGWEVVGGSPGGSNVTSTSNGYPIVNVLSNVTLNGELIGVCLIPAEPNTYYRMSLSNPMLVIDVNPFEWTNTSGKYLMFSFDTLNNQLLYEMNQITSYIGVLQTENTDINTKQTFPYKLLIPYLDTGMLEVFILNDLTESTNTMGYVSELADEPIPLTNIQVKQTDEYYLIQSMPCICNEVDNDSILYEHKYEIISSSLNLEFPDTVLYLYTYLENNQLIGNLFVDGQTTTFPISKFKSELIIDTVSEYVFEITTPISITAPDSLKWNNDLVPDLLTPGLFTLSIVNGIGCYSFVPQ